MTCKNTNLKCKPKKGSTNKVKSTNLKKVQSELEQCATLSTEPPKICILSSSYKIVQRASRRLNYFIEVDEKSSWNLLWTDAILTVHQCRELKKFQMVNFFPGIGEIARKDLLARNLLRMQKHFPDDYNFFPKTWWLPADLGDLQMHSRTHRGDTYIVKPCCGSQGRGILITKYVSDLETLQQCICQVYIPKPFLIDGFKFDIRIYILITSCDPLRIYAYNEGIVRFATQKYCEPLVENTKNVYMHLTNYSINKRHQNFMKGEDGSKRRISVVNTVMEELGVDIKQLWSRIDNALVKTVVPAAGVLKHHYHLSFPRHPQACFILLGVDVLLDADLTPYIIEVNRSPSLNIDSPIDEEVKEQLLVDTLRLINLGRLNKQRVQDEERRRVYERTQLTIVQRAKRREIHLEEKPNTYNLPNTIETQIVWEETHIGNFRKIYPAEDFEKYDQFFIQADNSIFQETLASRARKEHLSTQHRNNEAEGENLFDPSNLNGDVSDSDVLSSEDESYHSKAVKRQIVRGRIPVLNSFEPQYISMAEERERLRALDKREGLVRALNLKATIEEALSGCNPSIHGENGASRREQYELVPTDNHSLQIRATAATAWPRKDLSNMIFAQHITSTLHSKELRVQSVEVPLLSRPLPSRLTRWTSINHLQLLRWHSQQTT